MKFPAPPSEILQKERTHIDTFINHLRECLDVEVFKRRHKIACRGRARHQPVIWSRIYHVGVYYQAQNYFGLVRDWLHNKIQMTYNVICGSTQW